jgi:hypothetical protein
MSLRVPSPLDEELEAIVAEIIGACVTVRRELGPGLLEGIYRRALLIELSARGLPHDTETPVPVSKCRSACPSFPGISSCLSCLSFLRFVVCGACPW